MALIKNEFIEKLLIESDIVSIISDKVELKKQGQNFKGLSPFTNEKTPSFLVSPTNQRFYDYSANIAGNVIDFVKEINQCSFPQAVTFLAEKINLDVEYESKEKSESTKYRRNKSTELRSVLKFVLQHYISELQHLDNDHQALHHLIKKRGYNLDQISDWQIGFAKGNKTVYNLLAQKGWIEPGKELGLISDSNDKFYDRIIYPIYDSLGKLVGLAGRTISENQRAPKWINSSESELYRKHEIWFGLDRAAKEISIRDKAWIVEGYNDVIAWQENGILNTIASCGTSISASQLTKLKKYCARVIFCLDGDPAGKKSMLKNIPKFIKEGFVTEVIILPKNMDPDDFIREFDQHIKEEGVVKTLATKTKSLKGFIYLMENKLSGDAFSMRSQAKELCQLISEVKNDEYQNIYIEELLNTSQIGLRKSEVKKWIKEHLKTRKTQLSRPTPHEKYSLPKEVQFPLLPQIVEIIDKYGLLFDNNQIWSLRGSEGNYHFQLVSNFSIEILLHMADEKTPMKLLKIKNVFGDEHVFDVLSDNINTRLKFDNALTSNGNFLWSGNDSDFLKLRKYLFDNMGIGRRIEVLGWQHQDKIWVWNNAITNPENQDICMDPNGVFKIDGTSYYVPSANKVHKNNPFKYEVQKRVIVSNSNTSFTEFTSKMMMVHGSHAIPGILFSIASVYQDFIEEVTGGFPILFLYGPPSTGKDQLVNCCQSFFGRPQEGINLEAGASTVKGQIRTFAQLSNMICHLSEYKQGNSQMDGVIKGLWDKRGYVRGNLDSHVGTDNVPILSSAILTGNEYPKNDAVITRLIWCEMTKNKFTEDETKNYEELSEMLKSGISHLTIPIIQNREAYTNGFKVKYNLYKGLSQTELPEAHGRMLGNISILIATYDLLKDILGFPFTFNEVWESLIDGIKAQIRKLDSTNIITKFWDSLLASMRGHKDTRINVGRELNISGNILSIQFTNCYLKLQKEWYGQHQEMPPAKSTIMDALKKDHSFLKPATIRLVPGRSSNSKSVYQFDLHKINISDDIIAAAEWQSGEIMDLEEAISKFGKIEKLPF